MTSPVEIIAAHRFSSRRHIKNGEYLVNKVACSAEGCTWEAEWVRDESERIKLHAAHVAAALEEARPKPSVSDVETIALAWMRHQGYTEAQIEKAANATHQNSGCEAEGYDWLCYDENGKDNHPEWNDLSVAAEMANVALDALEEARRIETDADLAALPSLPGENEGYVIKDANGDIYELQDDGRWMRLGSGVTYAMKPKLPVQVLWQPSASEEGR